jgi:hypothetical protein
MRKVKAGNIHARFNQFESFFKPSDGWAHGANNFGFSSG